jgi:hypothetical protein
MESETLLSNKIPNLQSANNPNKIPIRKVALLCHMKISAIRSK